MVWSLKQSLLGKMLPESLILEKQFWILNRFCEEIKAKRLVIPENVSLMRTLIYLLLHLIMNSSLLLQKLGIPIKKRQLRFGWVSPLLQNAGGRSFLPSPRSRFGEFTGSGWPQGFKRQRPLWTDGFCEIIQSERGRKEGSPFTSRAERAPSRRGDLIQNLCQLYKLVSDFFPRLNRQA